MTSSLSLLQLTPQYHHRLWGGQHLQANPTNPIGEMWAVYEQNQIANGPLAGQALAEVSKQLGADLLGAKVFARTGSRFPLLIKLLDCADWLSVQVHPNDHQAIQLEGAGQFGKTEAWHILNAQPGAQVIAGVKPDTSPEALAQAIRGGMILEHMQYHTVEVGDTIFIPAGTVHALGPGLLLYEVQQTSDITYRVFDWNRPASAGRKLHIEQSVAVSDPNANGQLSHLPPLNSTDCQPLTKCDYFTLDIIAAETVMDFDTEQQSFHTLTVISGEVEATANDETLRLKPFETVVVPAGVGGYRLRPMSKARLLRARVG
jgi:mannose-6-phosphate isomerase